MYLSDKGRKRLATLMLIQERSHRDLAKAAGWSSAAHVGHLLKGRRNGVTPESAIAIARYLGVPVHEIFTPKVPAVDRQKVA